MSGNEHIVCLLHYARKVIDHAVDDIAAGHYTDGELAHLAAGFDRLTSALRRTDQPPVVDRTSHE